MGAERTSNKDILAAINEGNKATADAINALAAALTGNVTPATPERKADTPVVTTEPEVTRDVPAELRVKPAYLAHQKAKAQDHANNKGETVILYGRVNLSGEHKLAYCLKSRWSTLRDRGLIGAVAVFEPAS